VTETVERPLGHANVLRRLESTAAAVVNGAEHRLAHAVVFAGPSGVGKFKTALWWAGRLKCRGQDACSGADCRDCRQIAAGSHPDVTVVAPGPDDDAIYIENVRDLIRSMALRPVRPGPRIAILREAQTLTPQAQSAMLKLLEEPPGFALLVLVTDNAAALLPTIRSRCQLVRFGLLDPEDIRMILEAHGREPRVAARLASVSGGRAGRALMLTPEMIEDRDDVVKAYEELREGARSDIDGLVLDLVDRRKAGRPALEALLEWQMRKVETSLGCAASGGVTDELDGRLENAAAESAAVLLEEASRTAWAMRALERNGNPRLVLRELLLDVRDR